MQPKDVLHGHVQDAAGNPVEGVGVTAISAVHEQNGNQRVTWSVTDELQLTDKNGDFTLQVSPPLGPRAMSGKECISLRLRHPDYADKNVTRATLGLYELNPVITLHAGAAIEGRIEGWIATTDLSVRASKEPDPFGSDQTWSASRRISTGNTFQFNNVPAGVIYLHLIRDLPEDSSFGNSMTCARTQSVLIEPGTGQLKATVFQREDVGEISGVLRSATLEENVILSVALCSGIPTGEFETLVTWRGSNGDAFKLLNLTEPGKLFFLRVDVGSKDFDYPLHDSTKRDRDIGELNF